MRETIRLAGRVTAEDLTPVMRTDLTDLYRRWRAEGLQARLVRSGA